MIRPIATLPTKERERLADPENGGPHADPGFEGTPATTGSSRHQHPWWFITLEVLLLALVPVLGFFGGRALLSTTAGTFAEQALPGEPGWRVLVDPSPVSAVAEVFDDRVTGITIVAQPGQGTGGGALVMVPGSLRLDDGRSLGELAPSVALEALSAELRLGFVETFVVTPPDWPTVLGDKVYTIDNPDPILSADGSLAIPVGQFDLDANSAALFLGAPADGGNPLSLLFRRQLFWQALLADPPVTSDPVAALMEQVAVDTYRIDDLPTEPASDQFGDAVKLDTEAAEDLVNTVVPLPSGSAPGDRVVIRVVDRTGQNDAQRLALMLGARGFEVSEIANAEVFDNGPTQLVVPSLVDIEAMRELAADLGADTVSPDPVGETELSTVVLLVGSDLDLGN